jgi:tetratricopeptide (TPR) repeat protein
MRSILRTRNQAITFTAAVLAMGWFLATANALASQADIAEAEKRQMLSRYEKAKSEGKHTTAVSYLLEYTESAFGENAPETAKLTHRYGQLLYEQGDYRESTDVLLKALKRSNAAFGEFGIENFELNMNIGYTLSHWRSNLSIRTRYFDRGLEVLRETGEHETVRYVTTLVNIAANLMGGEGLGGEYSSTLRDNLDMFDEDEYSMMIEAEYSNYFYMAGKYIQEAAELADKLVDVDEYLASKIAIAQAKLNVLDTADRSAVPLGVGGYISGGTRRDRNEREEERLMAAIDQLSRDTDANRIYLDAANKVLMEIAWMEEDNSRMLNMCTGGALNSKEDYPPDRLYEVLEDGMVLAPELPLSINRNIFSRRVARREPVRDPDGNPVRRPYFMPVCIDGRLMAALMHAPRVTIEEIR